MALYEELENPLQNVLQEIQLDRDEMRDAKLILAKVVEQTLIPKMREEDRMFNYCFNRLKYTGSVYTNLKIDEPTEFDLNFVIQFHTCLQIAIDRFVPGAVVLKVVGRIREQSMEFCREFENWISEDGWLRRNKVYNWFRGVVDKSLHKLGKKYIKGYEVSVSQSGPAYTLHIKCWDTGKVISVDLVPVLEFSTEKWPPRPVTQLYHISRLSMRDLRDRTWFAVPKEFKEVRSHQGLDDIYWRMSFYDFEKDIMNDLKTMKPLIKLMKKLRDSNGWHKLASYFIVVIFLQEYISNKDRYQWNGPLAPNFMHMLDKLRVHLERRKIVCVWDRRCNLLEFVNPDTVRIIRDRVVRIMNKINHERGESREDVIYEVFGLQGMKSTYDGWILVGVIIIFILLQMFFGEQVKILVRMFFGEQGKSLVDNQ